eukprot:TRINITY_DN1600_c0_g1_i3.p1 TRINITY_DN1600_c0_g1~~TRINITY_DN1600_c0_g1_i3.p1  ORF type:complete len:2451 (+),score=487.30 TRINITY_DN1600_c0_g1_i3:50-7402(+)
MSRISLLVVVLVLVATGAKGQKGEWKILDKAPLGSKAPNLLSNSNGVFSIESREFPDPIGSNPFITYIFQLNTENLSWTKLETKGDVPTWRFGAGLAIDDKQIYLFGGLDSSGMQNDFYTLELESLTWFKVSVSGLRPNPRVALTIFFYKDSLYIYGGNNPRDQTDVWKFEGDFNNKRNGTWRQIYENNPGIDAQYGVVGLVHEDQLWLYGGCPISNPSCNALLSRFNFTKGEWDFVKYERKAQNTARNIIFNQKLYTFGGHYEGAKKPETFAVTKISLDNLTSFEQKAWTKKAKVSEYPITFPSGRNNIALAPFKDLVYVFGGLSNSEMNDVWVYNLTMDSWAASSMAVYPVPRMSPSIAKISNTEFALFGGLLLDSFMPPFLTHLNDLWIYNTEKQNWTRIEQESHCVSSNTSCAPNVFLSVFAHYQGSLFILGGFSFSPIPNYIARNYSLAQRTWQNIPLSLEQDVNACRIHFTAFRAIDSDIYIWGGSYNQSTKAANHTMIFSMTNLSFFHDLEAKSPPPPENGVSGLEIDSKFCIAGQYETDQPNMIGGVWCYNRESHSWTQNFTSPKEVILKGADMEFHHNIILVGGEKSQSTSADQFLVFGVNTNAVADLGSYVRPIAQQRAASVVMDGVMYLGFGQRGNLTNSRLQAFDLAELWCSGTTIVDGRNATISDGSGEFKYYPRTSCTWIVENVTHIQVENVSIGEGAELVIETTDECAKPMKLSGKEHKMIPLGKSNEGRIIETPSHTIRIRFNVSRNAVPEQGFSLKSFGCNAGFIVKNSSCTCESGRFINDFGNCVSCPVGTKQELENQNHCKTENPIQPAKAQATIKQGMLQELTEYPGPIFQGALASIGDNVYVVGGISSLSNPAKPQYMKMDVVHRADSVYESMWVRLKAAGDVPKERSGFCFVAVDGVGLLLGGNSIEHDPFVYEFNPSSDKWKRLLQIETSPAGAACAVYDGVVYLHGGLVNGSVTDETWKYERASNSMSRLSTKGPKPKIAYAAGGVDSKLWVLFGGYNGATETQEIYKFDFATSTWRDSVVVKLDSCVACEQDRPICIFNRQQASAIAKNGELHIFGGISQSDVLGDLLVIAIENSTIVHYENYGMYAPDLPLKNPPPKHGAASSNWSNSLLILGGMGSSNTIGNDAWVWDPETRTWSDSSVLRNPLHRTEATIVAESADSFIVFGGASSFVGELLLNDVWRFNTTENRWKALFQGSRSTGPSGRAGAVGAIYDGTLFIFGGRPSVRFSDDKSIWMFNLETMSWSSLPAASSLSRNERPFNRAGIRSAQMGHKVYLWGGELLMGLEDVERYSLVFEVDLSQKSVARVQPLNVGPTKRRYHHMRAMNQSAFYVFGGENFAGTPLNDAWVFNTETMRWAQIDILGNRKPEFVQSTFVGYGNSSVFFGGLRSKDSISWMIQHDFQRMASLGVWSDGAFPQRLFGHSAATIDKAAEITMFGGSDESWISNQLFRYKPGFCNPYSSTVTSSSTPGLFDDGSGDANYLTNTNCTWILATSNQLSVATKIRSMDRLHVFEVLADASLKELHTFKGAEPARFFSSKHGFQLHFEVSNSLSSLRGTFEDEPCTGCEGFEAVHAACPPNSMLSSGSIECVCESGYEKKEGTCILPDDSGKADFPPRKYIAPPVAVTLFLIVSYFIYHRRRLVARINQQDQKLYLKVNYSELRFFESLGSGGFGEVFRGEWRGTEVAIKSLFNHEKKTNISEDFEKEMEIMVQLRHPNIVLYMGACIQPPHFCIISELMNRGSLYDILHNSEITLDERTKISFLLQAAKGMQFLHSHEPPILHCDLKSPNLLLSEQGNLKISDFGLTVVSDEVKGAEQTAGSYLWMAPEVILGGKHSDKADIYSYAIVMWEVFHRQEPYDGVDALAVAMQVINIQLRPKISNDLTISPEAIQLMTKSWSSNPEERPSFQEIVKILSSESSHHTDTVQDSFSFVSSNFSSASDDFITKSSVALVATKICNLAKLWNTYSDETADLLVKHNEIVRDLISRLKGYESDCSNGNFLVAFPSTYTALDFCQQLSKLSLMVELPSSDSKRISIASHGRAPNSTILLAMTLHFGSPTVRKSPTTQRREYSGVEIEKIEAMKSRARAGQFLCSEDFYNEAATDVKTVGFRLSASMSIPFESEVMSVHEIISERKSSIKSIVSSFAQSSGEMGIEDIENYESDWYIDFEELQQLDELVGSGSYGTVFLAKFKEQKVAVKKFARQKMRERKLFSLISEIMIHTEVEHPHIVKFFGACTKQPNICIVMEYAPLGSLQRILHQEKARLSEKQKLVILLQIADAMDYLHKLNPPIFHRDLKSANILVFSLDPIVAKITDFGFARTKSDNQTMTKCGTQAWIAPEILNGNRYDGKADVYSFGIVVWEVFLCEKPWASLDALRISTEVVSGRRPTIPSHHHPKVKALITSCWSQIPSDRPSFEEILNQLRDI